MSGKYVRDSTIASGGMATVWKGRVVGAQGFDRVVAIKVMHPHLATDPAFAAMFLDEARLSSRIRHPNVVPTLDAEQGPEGLFLVMEFVDGLPLHRVMRADGDPSKPLPLPATLRIALDVLAGLHAAHELVSDDGRLLGVVHRDVSPHNVLVGVDGIARLVDFGVAKASERLQITKSGQVKGKLAYMSTEQIIGVPVDRRSDVYAFAIILWELLTGHRAFDGNDGQIALAVAQGLDRDPRTLVPSIPDSLAETCMRALRPLPEDRYETAAAFAEALEDAAEKAGVRPARPREIGALIAEIKAREPPSPTQGSAGGPRAAAGTEASGITAGPSVVDTRARASRRRLVIATGLLAALVVAVVALMTLRREGTPSTTSAKGNAATGHTSASAPLPLLPRADVSAVMAIQPTVAPVSSPAAQTASAPALASSQRAAPTPRGPTPHASAGTYNPHHL